MPIPDSLKLELNKIPHLSSIGLALLKYAESISRSSPVWESEQWVFRSANFMTFRVQHRRNFSFKISLRGSPDEFWEFDGVQLHPQMGNGAYRSFHLELPEQSAAAFLLVRTAMDNYRRGGAAFAEGQSWIEAQSKPPPSHSPRPTVHSLLNSPQFATDGAPQAQREGCPSSPLKKGSGTSTRPVFAEKCCV